MRPAQQKAHRSHEEVHERHERMGVTETQFNGVVKCLVRAMEAHAIGPCAQNRLLARQMPMHDDIVGL